MEGQARSALLVARSARNQQVSPSKILFFPCEKPKTVRPFLIRGKMVDGGKPHVTDYASR
jgi:hypothetical protein